MKIQQKLPRLFKHRSMKWNMAVSFSVLIFLSINAVGYLSYSQYSKGAEENAAKYTYEIVKQISRNADYYIRYMEDISTLSYFNQTVQDYLKKDLDSTDPEVQRARALEEVKITQYFNSFLSIRQDIVSIYIFGNKGQVVSNRNDIRLKDYIDIREQPWYREAVRAGGRPVLSPTHVQNFIRDEYHWVISLSREINHLDTKESLGVFLINLNFKVIQEICDRINLEENAGYVFIVDQEGNLIYHPQQQLIYSKVKSEDTDLILKTKQPFVTTNHSEREKLYTIVTSEETDWKFVGVTYTDQLVPNKNEIRNFYIMLSLISMPFTLILSTLIASRVSRPIKRLEETMKKVEKGQFDVKAEIEGHKEVAHLSHTFNIMVSRIKHLMGKLLEEQELKRKNELKVLQSQINPHFLYNTLDSVIWMAQRGKADEIIQIIASLSRLFRVSIGKGFEWISIKEEIEHVKSYLQIQKLRYKKKLDFIIDVDQSIMRYKVPRIILQPIVENAIYHGIKPLPEGGLIQIRGYLEDSGGRSVIRFEVIDNGVGIPADRLKEIFKGRSSKIHGGGVGIKNVQERIQLYAGKAYGIRFFSEEGSGTTVVFTLPVETEEAGVQKRSGLPPEGGE